MNRLFYGAAALVVVAIVGGLFLKRHLTSLATDKVKSALASASKYADFSYDSVSVHLLSRTVHISNLTVRPVGLDLIVRVQDVALSEIDRDHQIPHQAHIALQGIKSDATQLASLDSTGLAKALGATDQEADLEIKYYYDEGSKRVSIERLRLGARQLFEASASAVFGNVAFDDQGPTTSLDALGNMWLESLEIRYRDDGLIPKLVVATAAEDKSSVNVAVEKTKLELASLTRELPETQREAFLEFVDHPGEIRIRLAPKVPISFARLLRVVMTGELPNEAQFTWATTRGREDLLTLSTRTAQSRLSLDVQKAKAAMQQGNWIAAASALEKSWLLLPKDPAAVSLSREIARSAGKDLSIISVDFDNFAYESKYCIRQLSDDGFRNPIKVVDGKAEIGEEAESAYFQVKSVMYHDFDNDGLVEAAVEVTCTPRFANWFGTELFLFSMRDGEPTLLTTIDNDVVNADLERQIGESFWSVSFGMDRDVLTANGAAGGYHAEPAYSVSMRYRWNGQKFQLAGKPSVSRFIGD
jgi:hypothetical protein